MVKCQGQEILTDERNFEIALKFRKVGRQQFDAWWQV